MDNIRYIKLKNTGGFVAQIEVQYKEKHTDGQGNVSYDAEWKSWHYDGYRDICAGAERTVDPLLDAKIPDGAQVRPKAVVVWGSDRTSDENYIYQESCSKMDVYEISGTTLINKLKRVSFYSTTLLKITAIVH
jgi:hypothetical protein